MKLKKKMLIGLVMVLSVVLVACGAKRPDAKEAAEVLVNAYVYDKDEDKLKKYFQIEMKNKDEEIAAITESLVEAGLDEETVLEIANTLLDKAKAETSYKVTNVKEADDGKAEVTYEVVGMSLEPVEAAVLPEVERLMLEHLKENGIELSSLAELEKIEDVEVFQKIEALFNAENFEAELTKKAIINALEKYEVTAEPTTITVTLVPDKDSKKHWDVEDLDELSRTFDVAFLGAL